MNGEPFMNVWNKQPDPPEAGIRLDNGPPKEWKRKEMNLNNQEQALKRRQPQRKREVLQYQ